MSNEPFSWPDDVEQCATLARSLFIERCVSDARYWIDWSADFLTRPEPAVPFERNWSDVAKEDRAFRDVFVTLTEAQRAKVLELLNRCIHGAVFSTLCALDQFPHGEAEIRVRDGVCGKGTRSFPIAPTKRDLHDDFMTAFLAKPPAADAGQGS